jgi:nitroreductase
VFFFSAQTVSAFTDRFPELNPASVKAVCFGESALRRAQELGIQAYTAGYGPDELTEASLDHTAAYIIRIVLGGIIMSNSVLSAIADRRSIRAYKSDKVTKEQLDTLLQAAQQSPSAGNRQPWHFSIVQNPGILKEINAEVAKALNKEETDLFFGAPLVIFLSSDTAGRWARLDCGIATQTLALAAHSIGLGSVILGRPEAAFTGPRAEYFHQLLKFPSDEGFAVAIAIGIPAGTKEAHPIEPDRVIFVD